MNESDPRSTHPEPSGCVLSLDVGTSSVRMEAYDLAGRALPSAPGTQLPSRWRVTPDGGMEISADDLLERTVAVIDAAVADARGAGREVVAVAAATFWHSLLGLGADGEPVTPLFGWGDTRARGAAALLRARLDEVEMHRRTGCFLHPSYPATKLRWLRDAFPDAFRRAATWIGFGEYLALRLFGERRGSVSLASGTGLLDVRSLRWDAEMLDLLGLGEDTLFPLADADTPLRGLRPEWAARWPELADVPWFPPLGDGACANAGSGAVGPGRLGLTVGTSAALRTLWEVQLGAEPEVPPGLWCYRLDTRRWVAGGALSNGGSVAAHLDHTLRLPPREEWDAALAAYEPDSHGLTVLPLWLGERSPGWRAAARAAIVGATQNTAPLDVLRASLEAVALRLARVHAAIEAGYGPTRAIIAGGGALHASPVWTQIIADALGRTLTLSAEAETTSRGAALVALEGLGFLPDLQSAPPPGATEFQPDPARHAWYRTADERQRELEELLLPWLARHPLNAS